MFIAHKNSIPNGTSIPLPQFQNKKVLTHNNGFKLISNVCPHQGSLISTGPVKNNRICPYHGWTFDLNGTPVSSGKTSYYCKNDSSLPVEELYEWNGLLFSSPVNFEVPIDFSKMVLEESRVDVVKSNPENIMDLFLDVDHIPIVHKGVYEKIGIDDEDVQWTFYQNGSVQKVQDKAYWIAVYPYTMIEWQDGGLFITVAEKIGERQSNVYVFKYRDDQSSILRWKTNETVWETAWAQDKAQSELLTKFSDKNLEPAKQHYRTNGFNI